MKTFKVIVAIGFVLGVSACSPYRYYAIQSGNTVFSNYRTFAWLPPADSLRSNHYNEIVDEKIKDGVTAGLETRGLILRARKPDLLVRYSILVNDRMRAYSYPVYVYDYPTIFPGVIRYRDKRLLYYNYGRPYPVYVGSEIIPVPYKEGTLIIDLIDRSTQKVIWRGYGVGEIDNPEQSIRDIPVVVDGILAKLPLLQAQRQALSKN